MYEPLKRLALSLLKTPHDSPRSPSGSHDSVEIFRASPKYLSYRMLGFWLHTALIALAELAFVATSIASHKSAVGVVAVLVAVYIVVHPVFHYLALRLHLDLRHYIVYHRSPR